MATEHARTQAARELAETALARLAVHAGPHADELVVVGGLVPARLTATAATTHIGTTDVDLVVDLAVVYDRDEQDFSWLETALTEAGFTEDPHTAKASAPRG